MSIHLKILAFLASEQGQNLLEQLSHQNLSEQNTLKIITRLRQEFDMEQASALLTMAILRQKAVTKFGDAAIKMFFTDTALQQASDPLIRAYRAKKSQNLAVLDLCCGIAADSLAFASAGASVHGIDINPLRIAIAGYNADMLGIDASFEIADARVYQATNVDMIFFDPARRDEHGKRIFDVEGYIPPLSLIKNWQSKQIMIKLAPGVDLNQLKDYGGLVEFISVSGDLKEAVLYLGTEESGLKATLFHDGEIYHWQREGDTPDINLAEPRGYLLEPDASILRANLVQDITWHFSGWMLDETIAYFCCDVPIDSPWVRRWRIRDWMPFNLKKLRAYLREADIGKLTVKKRGSAIQPEDLIKQLKLKGNEPATLVLTRYKGQQIVVICDEMG
jgi:hypothetical protein